MDNTNKFKANPYNLNNNLLKIEDIINIMKKLNINDFNTNNLNIYQKSFIHKSYCKLKDYEEYDYPGNEYLPLQEESYETIEFLGDSILGSVVSSYIYKRFHLIYGENEGFLTKLKIRLVCGENLYDVSKKMGFPKHIIISKHIDDNCSGRDNKNILEDVLESFIGALYMDKGYNFTEKFIINMIEEYCDFTEIILRDTNYKDQISRYFQKTYSVYPIYKTEKFENVFKSSLWLKEERGESMITFGTGDSKKRAEQDVSKKALIHFNVITS